ncbi:MAG: exodeoxyribonuclease VII small subunit [Saccharofermentanales bacterium]
MTKSIKKQAITYEEAIDALEKIIQTLEKGETTLEESMKLFTDGMELSKICSEKIDSIEHRITQLVNDAQCQVHEVEFED